MCVCVRACIKYQTSYFEYCQRRTREVEEVEVRVLKDRPLLVQVGTQTDQDQLVKVCVVGDQWRRKIF